MLAPTEADDKHFLRTVARELWEDLAPGAWQAFLKLGRGALAVEFDVLDRLLSSVDVDDAREALSGKGLLASFVYVPLPHLRTLPDDVVEAVAGYDPALQLVLLLVGRPDLDRLHSAVLDSAEAVLAGKAVAIVAQHLPAPASFPPDAGSPGAVRS